MRSRRISTSWSALAALDNAWTARVGAGLAESLEIARALWTTQYRSDLCKESSSFVDLYSQPSVKLPRFEGSRPVAHLVQGVVEHQKLVDFEFDGVSRLIRLE